jgi:hypothetical protein
MYTFGRERKTPISYDYYFFSFLLTHKVHKPPLGHPLSVRKNLQGFASEGGMNRQFTCALFFWKKMFETDIYI